MLATQIAISFAVGLTGTLIGIGIDRTFIVPALAERKRLRSAKLLAEKGVYRGRR